MKTLTLRGLDLDTFQRIRDRASESGNSINRYTIQLLHKVTHQDDVDAEHRDLDKYFSSWDEETFKRVNKAITEQRGIDTEIWS